jgi:hypothetical protein
MEVLVRRISGIITVVQEGRFRLSSDDGRSFLFTLSNGAALEPQDLPPLLQARVEVLCTERSDRKEMTAHRIEAAR